MVGGKDFDFSIERIFFIEIEVFGEIKNA